MFADLHLAACTTYDLRPAKPPVSKLDGDEGKEGAQSFDKVLEILDETPIASEPGEGRSTFRLGAKHRPVGSTSHRALNLRRRHHDTPEREPADRDQLDIPPDIGRCNGGWCRGHRLSQHNGASAEGHAANSDNHPAA